MSHTHFVPSTGVDICVTEHTPAGAGRATVVLVHGYPDRQEMWQPLLAELAGEDLHLVTYDVRGAGRSGAPATTAGYRTELLLDDLAAVLDATLPEGGRAHLVGHDWGSVQLWDAVATEATDPRLRDRLASFTSISGPPLDHAGWLARHPRGRELALLRQAAHSWYVYAFQLPVLPELLWRVGGGTLARVAGRLGGTDHLGPDTAQDAARGVNLYRANVPRRMARPGGLLTTVPVLVVHPTRDRFVTGVLHEELERRCAEVRVVEVEAGHWVPRSRPAVLAGLVLEQVRRHG